MNKEPEVKRLILDSYLAVITNSVGTKMFKNFYALIDGKKKDVMKDGWLSCAFYVSSVLAAFSLIREIHATVSSTVRDLETSGWEMIKKPRPGSILVWSEVDYGDRGLHKHIGFYIGRNKAISTSWKKKYPVVHHWTFRGSRKADMILWNPKLK